MADTTNDIWNDNDGEEDEAPRKGGRLRRFGIFFLVLAAVGEADALVSGDGDIQALKAQFHIPIFTVAEFADWLQAH